MKKSTLIIIPLIVMAIILLNCTGNKTNSRFEETKNITMSILKSSFGIAPDGQEVFKYSLKNARGMEVDIITYGGIVTSIKVPDKKGTYENVVLGFDSLGQYFNNDPYFGAIIGRYCNRIAKGQFMLNDTLYRLATNDDPNHLHGGVKGFDKVVWNAHEEKTDSTASLKLRYISKDGEENYPGTLKVYVEYTLKNNNAITVDFEAYTDKETILNLTQHSYFNLSGDFSKDILGEVLTIHAEKYLPVDATLIPTGEIRPVENTPFDFRQPKVIGRDIGQEDEQLLLGKGYDHCWVLNNQGTFRRVATLSDTISGRYLEVFSDQPGIQFYSGNFLDGTLPIPGGGTYGRRAGLCLETQHYPDSPNHEKFPSTILRPGDRYETRTAFVFSTK